MLPLTSTTTHQDQTHPWITRLDQAAQKVGAILLDRHWRGSLQRYTFACPQGHTWAIVAKHISPNGLGACPTCLKAARMQALHRAVQPLGSACLDTEWRGNHAHYHFRCSLGHTWQRTASHIRRGYLNCPRCLQIKDSKDKLLKDGLERLQRAACEHGGECLSDTYAGLRQRYSFRCSQGHEWHTVGNEVLRGAWCITCARMLKNKAALAPDGLERLHRIARERGGECLSNAYLGRVGKYRFRCAKGHEWEVSGNMFFLGSWCRACSAEKRLLGIDVAHQAAAAKGGLCLSTTYQNSSPAKLTWQCDRGHVWGACLSMVRRGHWCPQCAIMARITNKNSKAGLRYSALVRHETDFAGKKKAVK